VCPRGLDRAQRKQSSIMAVGRERQSQRISAPNRPPHASASWKILAAAASTPSLVQRGSTPIAFLAAPAQIRQVIRHGSSTGGRIVGRAGDGAQYRTAIHRSSAWVRMWLSVAASSKTPYGCTVPGWSGRSHCCGRREAVEPRCRIPASRNKVRTAVRDAGPARRCARQSVASHGLRGGVDSPG